MISASEDEHRVRSTYLSCYKTRHTPRTIVAEHVSFIMVLLEVDINSSVQQVTVIPGQSAIVLVIELRYYEPCITK